MNTSVSREYPARPSRSWKGLIEGPLRQAAVLLWLVGGWRLGEQVLGYQITWEWVVAAGIATVAAFLLIAQVRILWLSFVPTVLGLGVVLGIGHQFELGFDGLCILTTAYPLTLWVAVPRVLAASPMTRLGQFLGLAGGHGAAGGRSLVRAVIHGTGCVVLTIALIGVALNLIFGASVRPDVLWTTGLAAVFFWLTGWHYQSRFHSYFVLLSVTCGTWLAVVYFEDRRFDAGFLDDGLALTTLGLCFGFSLIAIGLERWRGGLVLTDLTDSLYRRALRNTSIWLASAVVTQQIFLGLRILGNGGVPDGTLFVVAGLAILLANHAFASMRWSAGGVILIATGVYALLFGWIASGDVLMPHPLTAAVLVSLSVAAAWMLGKVHGLELLYLAPTRFVSNVAYAGALVSASFSAPFLVVLGQPDFLLTTVLLFVTTVAVIRGPTAPIWRGLILAVLSSVLFYNLLAYTGRTHLDGSIAVAWGFALWGLATFGLKFWNGRFAHWNVEPLVWPWLGLAFVVIGGLEGLMDPEFLWLYLVALSVYSGLMLRHSGLGAFAWLAGATATLAGLAATDWWLLGLATGHLQELTFAKFWPTLVWLNALLALGSWWRRRGDGLSDRLGLPVHSLAAAFTVWPTFVLAMPIVLLAGGGAALTFADWLGFTVRPSLGAAALCVAVGASGLHAATCLRQDGGLRIWSLHSVWLCVYLTMLYAFAVMGDDAHSTLASALWALGFALIHTRWGRDLDGGTLGGALSQALPVWIALAGIVAAGLMLFDPDLAMAERLAVLFILGVVVGLQGWWRASRGWLWGAAGIFVLFQHALWLLWFTPWELIKVLPFMALTSLAVSLSITGVVGQWRLSDETGLPGAIETRHVLHRSASFLLSLAAIEVVAHGLSLFTQAFVSVAGVLDMGCALLTYVLLVGIWIRRAHRDQSDIWIYAAAVLGIAAFVHLRTAWLGPAPMTAWDTGVLIGAAYGLFVVQRMPLSVPTMHVVLGLPLIALLTLPPELGSVHAGSALLAMSVLYLLIRGSTGATLPLYLGFLSLNGAMYLWIPLWVGGSGLLQLYVIPAAVSVLVLLQLHQRELKPGVLNGGRLAALSVLYVAAAVDLFVQPGLGMFATAIGLAIAGIVIGIAFRIRAFLYAGVAFLVLNVGAHLIEFYPEQRLGRAVLLLTLGVFITGGMITFNIKREAIMQRVRGIRTDLADWQ